MSKPHRTALMAGISYVYLGFAVVVILAGLYLDLSLVSVKQSLPIKTIGQLEAVLNYVYQFERLTDNLEHLDIETNHKDITILAETRFSLNRMKNYGTVVESVFLGSPPPELGLLLKEALSLTEQISTELASINTTGITLLKNRAALLYWEFNSFAQKIGLDSISALEENLAALKYVRVFNIVLLGLVVVASVIMSSFLRTQRSVMERLEENEQDALKGASAKGEYLANMSHEIRTPLNAIIGFSQLLAKDPLLTPRQRGDVETIYRSGEHLLGVINDILEISRIETGKITFNPQPLNIHQMLDMIEKLFQTKCAEKGLLFSVQKSPALPEVVEGDEGKLSQIIINLVGNAVKFTKAGQVTLDIDYQPLEKHPSEQAPIDCLLVTVTDSGPGISRKELKDLFRPFEQGAAGYRDGGSGLGLVISRRYAKAMGGDISVESELGKGSSFRLEIPAPESITAESFLPPSERSVTGIAPRHAPVRLLIVDDNKDNRVLLKAMLCPLGFETLEAINGKEALDVYSSFSPHAVLMDIRMPVMDGYEATLRIKAGEAGSPVPVIALTASVFEEAREKMESVGMSGYVRKPFREMELLAALGKCLDLEYTYKENNTLPPSPGAEGLEALPQDVCEIMCAALNEGDMTRFMELASGLAEAYPAISRKLMDLADDFDYTALKHLLGLQGR